MKKLILLALFLAACSDNQPVGNLNVKDPAKSVELSKYLGKWYELARYENKFEEGCEFVTATYTLRDDGMVKVLNACTKDGVVKDIEGKAKVVGDAKLKVSFFGPFYGDYWVLDRADDYSWAIVGEPSGKYLWILTRSPKADLVVLTARVKELGYDTKLLKAVKQF